MNPSASPSTVPEAILAIDELNYQELSSEQYFTELLSIVIDMQSATAGCIWQLNGTELEAMVTSSPMAAGIPEHQQEAFQQETQDALRMLGDRVLSDGRSLHSRVTGQNAERLVGPDAHLCGLAVPLANHDEVFGVVTLLTSVSSQEEADHRLQALDYAGSRVRQGYVIRNFSNAAEELTRLRKARDVVDGITKYVEPRLFGHEVVNRLREYLAADRVTLLFKKGNRAVTKAISNQAVFDRRSNVVRTLERLASSVVTIEEKVWFPSQSPIPETLKKAIDRHLDATDCLSLAVLPVFSESKRRDDPEDIAATIQSDQQRLECVAVLILEGMKSPLHRSRIERRWARIETPVSSAIGNARKFDSLFLMPLWRTLGQFADLYRGHTQRKAILITTAIVLTLTALFAIPAEFKLRGDGTINPQSQQHVFAETKGKVERIHYEDGQYVNEGDLLAELDNPELMTRIAEVNGKLNENRKRLETITVQRVSRVFESEEEQRDLVRNATSLETRIEGLERELQLLLAEAQQLQVISPIAGTVVTWDTETRLANRPVERGDRLLTVANPESGWEIALRIPDKRAGYLLRRWNDTNNSNDMTVSFVLASNPTEVLYGTVGDVSPLANVSDEDDENVIRVTVQLDEGQAARLDSPRAGTTVIGHVHCGKASLAYCKLYEFFDWVRRVWFKFVA